MMAHFLFWASAGSIVVMSLHMFYTAIKERFESQRNFRKWAIDEVSEQRRIIFRQKKSEKIHSISRAIEAKTYALPSEPLDTERSYALPLEWGESGREHVWGLILKHFDEPNDILNLSETCPLFQWLLRGKYKAAKFAEVYKVSLANSRRGGTLQRFTNDLLPLRLVCETTRKSVDELLMKPRPCNTVYMHLYKYLGPDSIFLPSIMPPGVRSLLFIAPRQLATAPLLVDFLLGMQRQIHVPAVIESLREKQVAPFSSASATTLYMNDIFLNEVDLGNLPEVRASFNKLFELAGECVSSVLYFTEQSGHDTYETLQKWIPLLPNLKKLRLSRKRQENEVIANLIEPFTPAPKLTSFQELNAGLPAPYLTEILKVTPTLKHIELSHFPEDRLAALVNGGVLDQLPLEVFNCGQVIPVSFLQRQFHWPLRTIILEGTPYFTIPCQTLMNFVNRFAATLQELLVPTFPKVVGGMLKLPNLSRLKWSLQYEAGNLEFMNPLQSLEKLDIFVYYQTREKSTTKEKVLSFLKKNNVPRLFPAMKRIKALVPTPGGQNWAEWEVIWKMGDDE